MSEKDKISVQRLHPVERHFLSETVLKVAWSPVGGEAAVITADGMLHLVSTLSVKSPRSVMAHEAGALSLAWSPNGLRLATSGQDGSVKVWRRDDLVPLASHQLGPQWVEHIAWQSDERFAAGMGKRLFVATTSPGSDLEIAAFEHSITGIEWRASEELVATMNGRALRLKVDGDSATTVGHFTYPEAMLRLALSPNHRFAAIGCQDSSARVWTLDENDEAVQMSGYQEKVQVVAWDRNSECLAVSGGAHISVWSFAGAGPRDTKPLELLGHRDVIAAASFAPEGKRLVSVDRAGVLCLWDLARGTPTPIAAALNKSAIHAAEWCAAGDHLLTGDQDGSIALWNVECVGR